MYIYYNDRICPVQTLARDFTMKLYGKASYRGMTPEQVLTGWIFFPDSWSETLPQDTGTSAKALKKAREKQEAAMLVCTAGILKIFPVHDDAGSLRWYSSVDRLPAGMDPDQWLFVRKVMSLAGESIVRKDFADIRRKRQPDCSPATAALPRSGSIIPLNGPRPYPWYALSQASYCLSCTACRPDSDGVSGTLAQACPGRFSFI